VVGLLGSTPALASLPLETESARIMPAGTLKSEVAFEWQTSDQGRELALPIAIEYAFANDFEASGGELVGLLGARYQLVRGLYPSLGVTYDNQGAVMIRAGLTWKVSSFGEGESATPSAQVPVEPAHPPASPGPGSAAPPPGS
jgi:hypothetical protein